MPNRTRAIGFALFLAILPAFGSSWGTVALASQEAAPASTSGVRFEPLAVLKALAEAYPGRIGAIAEREGEWGFSLDGRDFLWAGGRLLPADRAASAREPGEGSPQPFYPYPRELPPLLPLASAERARLEALLAERDRNPPARDPAFLDALWGTENESAAYAKMKTIRFLGKNLLIHRDLLEELALIEAEILEMAGRDREVALWVEGLGTVGGYFWRPIAGTRSRSYHSYGAAIDLVPARTGGRQWYWLDARRAGLPWRELPYSSRVVLPPKVVEAFERQGFIWGGKWLYWDAVHFEYRPEILLLSGFQPELQKPLRRGVSR